MGELDTHATASTPTHLHLHFLPSTEYDKSSQYK